LHLNGQPIDRSAQAASQPTPPSAPEPKPLTAKECEQALMRGDTVRVKCASGAVGVYRIRLGELRFRHGADWLKSTAGISMILEDVRYGAECFLVPDPSEEQEVVS